MARFTSFPHLPLIEDQPTRDNLRLLWDRLRALEVSLTTEATELKKLAPIRDAIEPIKRKQARHEVLVRKNVIPAGTFTPVATTTTDPDTGEVTGPAPPGPPEPSTEPDQVPPNRLDIVNEVATDTGYPSSGINVQDFTQEVARRLGQTDPKWGRRLNDSGIVGKDTVAFRQSDGDPPYSVDIVLGAAGPNPTTHWSPHGRVGGTWFFVN